MLYLDHNATTPLAPEAASAMRPWLEQSFGNPSSAHRFGREARDAVERARAAVARLLCAGRSEIAFTSGGTEADATAIHAAVGARPGRRTLVASAVEHPAVLRPLERLAQRGWRLRLLGVDGEGALDERELIDAIDGDVALVALMLANNETGVVTPSALIARAARAARERGAHLHVDAVQAAGKIAIDVRSLGADTLALSAHKLHGPQGVGCLWIRPGLELEPLIAGGSQEGGRRAGTENVAGIAGFARACELASAWLAAPERAAALAARRDRLERDLLASIPGASAVAAGAPRLPNTSSVSFEGLQAEALQMWLDAADVAVSTGAACHAHARSASHVLLAMGLALERAGATLRFSLGRDTTDLEVERAAALVAEGAAALRALAPVD